MQQSQRGFTLIELVVVIVLLGILGVTALGKFQNLSTEAQTAANQGVASEISAAAAINFAAATLGTTGSIALTGSIDCSTDLAGLFSSGTYPTGISVTGAPAACVAAGDPRNCSVAGSGTPAGATATATVICTGP